MSAPATRTDTGPGGPGAPAGGRWRPGDVLAGKYRLVRPMGAGGMGMVFEAVNTWTERRVAVKLLRAADPSPEVVERFLREARAASRVEHPHVVQVLDMGRDPADDALFIVQELLDGESLRGALDARGPLPLREACEALVPVMGALALAHARGVVHRDVKPENVMLVRDASGARAPRLIDFGVARIVDPAEPLATRAGELLGTVGYMAPEQVRGDLDVDGRADVWALGVLWFELLTGRRPVEGRTAVESVGRVLGGEIPSLGAARPGLPAPLVAAVDRALARDRAARHPTMTAFLDALAGCEELRREAWFRALVAAREAAPAEPRRAAAPRAVKGAACAAALAALAALGWAFAPTRGAGAAATVRPVATTEVVAPVARVAEAPATRDEPAPPAPASPPAAREVARSVQPLARPSRPSRATAPRRDPPAPSTPAAPAALALARPPVNGALVLDP